MSELRIGIVGVGNIAQRVYLPELARMEGVSVLAVCDTALMKAQRVADQYQIPHVCERPQDLVQLPDLDAIVICTPNGSHAAIAHLALHAAKHVICEKPMAVTPHDARQVLELACQRQKTVLVSFTNRFRPDVALLRSMIHGGELGQIYHCKVGWLRRRGVPGLGSWFTSKSAAGGGVLIDLGSHLLDIALWLLPPPPPKHVAVFGTCHALLMSDPDVAAQWYGQPAGVGTSVPDVEDTVAATLVLDDQLSISLEVTWATHEGEADSTYITVLGTEGAADLRTLFGFSTEGTRSLWPLTRYSARGRAPSPIKVPGADDPLLPYQRQLEYFTTQLRQGGVCLDMAEAGVRNLLLIDAIYTAHQSRSLVRVDLESALA